LQIVNLHHPRINIESFTIKPGESWCLYGPNRSGIDAIVDLFCGTLCGYQADVFNIPAATGVLSFRLQQELFEEELRNDDSNFLDRPDPGTLVREFLTEDNSSLEILAKFDLLHLLDHGYRQLSSGQSRKLLIACEILKGTQSLLIQNPYDGLDEKSCRELDQLLAELSGQQTTVIITVNNPADIPDWCTHLAIFQDRQLNAAGSRSTVQAQLAPVMMTADAPPPATFIAVETSEHSREELIMLEDGHAAYGDNLLFAGLNLSIHTGDHTLITGPNGCGKSTLLDLITGDHQHCYTNRLRLFGRPRGSGESIWEIKKWMGIVSPGLHRDHRVPGNAIHIILSGLFDTIGLYRKAHPPEIRQARQWLEWLNMTDVAETPFRRLTFAEQRLILIGRALIKQPKLLILDEPTQGLDAIYRHRVLTLLETCAADRLTTILFVSHRRDEHRTFFTQHIELNQYAP
jgi:molybdate transport system ATP-binding protein